MSRKPIANPLLDVDGDFDPVNLVNPYAYAAAGPTWHLSGGIASADCIAAFQPIGAADYSASLRNINNPGTGDAFAGSAPSWDAVNGWVFNGTTHYLNTGIIPAASMSVIVRFERVTSAAGEKALVGHFLDGSRRLQLTCDTGTGQNRYHNAGNLALAGTLTNGTMAVCGQNAYRNGSSAGTTDTAFSGTCSATMLFGARRREDSVSIDAYADVNIHAAAFYSRVLNSTEIAAVHAAMAAL